MSSVAATEATTLTPRPVFLVNDALAQGPGQSTLWHNLVSWFSGEFIGGDFPGLGRVAAERLAGVTSGVCVRNASWFAPFDSPIPVVSLLQDVLPEGHPGRPQQVEVCQRSQLIVANSKWTLAQYPELTGLPTKIIPLPVDFHAFRPREDAGALRAKWGVRERSICWVGSGDVVKGYDILHRLIAQTSFNYVVVRKDKVNGPDWPDRWGGRCRNFGQLTQADLAEIMASCVLGLCTSRSETQHLAGIEMMACGLPVVAPAVGFYAGGDYQIPGYHHGGNIGYVAENMADIPKGIDKWMKTFNDPEYCGWVASRPYAQKFCDPKICRTAWEEVVASV